MCGIAGFVGRGSAYDLEAMIGRIRYRGPDDKGIFLNEDVGLAHARLSVIDLSSAARQPMSSADGAVTIVFNGEIYNYRELKKIPELSGYPFRTGSDTEIILALWEAFREDAFERMNGMFALALYDRRERKLVLARDRAGKKPLYWGVFETTLLFGSELKALMAHPSFKKKLDLEAVRYYLSLDYVPTPKSIFLSVQKLEPGTMLVWQGGKARAKSFWRLDPAPWTRTFSAAVEHLDELLDRAVRERLLADVGLGLLLSGGLDSSLVAYYAVRHSSKPLETFSIGFGEDSFNEAGWARAVAKHLGTDHHELVATPKDALDLVPGIADFLDEPLADASILPTYLVSQFARSRVVVALSGDGGDELFAGYQTFKAERAARAFGFLPGPFRALLQKVAAKIPPDERYFSWEFKAKRFLNGFDRDPATRHMQWLGNFSRSGQGRLLRPEFAEALSESKELELPRMRFGEFRGKDQGNRLLYLYFRTYLLDQVLVKVDRASMRHALEARSPLLDYRVVEFAFSLPYEWKHKGLSEKYILKRLMKGRLPEEILQRKKHGFAVPMSSWLKHELKDFVQEVLSPIRTDAISLFEGKEIERLKKNHQSGEEDNAKMLWNLMVFYLWHQRWMQS